MRAKKLMVSLAGAALVTAPFVAGSLTEPAVAKAGSGVVNDPPDCGSHVPCPGDPAPNPRSSIDELCRQHIRCPDGGDGGVDPTPDDGCVPGRCNYDSPYYGEPDVPPPNDVPGEKVSPKAKSKTSSSAKPKADIPLPPDCGSHVPCPGDPPVAEAKAPRAIKAQPRTVG